MTTQLYRLTQTVLMTALGLLMAYKLWTGNVFYYINERFLPLIVFGAAAALALALGAAWRWRRGDDAHDHPDHSHDHAHPPPPARFSVATVLLVALPVLLGVIVPARPLGASAVDNKGVNTTGPLTVSGGAAATTLEIPPEKRTILDWVRAFNYADDPAAYNEQPADIVGFVFRDDVLGPNQVMVGRFMVTCCAADASAVAMIVEWPEAAALADNAWVRVRGPVSAATLNGKPIPLVSAVNVEVVEQPEHPYMYP